MFSLFQRKPRQAKSARRIPPSFRPRLEALEDRCLLSAPGTLDPTFGSGGTVTTPVTKGNDSATGVLIQPNGDIIAYGYSSPKSGTVFSLVRYLPNGSLDSTFGSGGIVTTSFGHSGDAISQAALQADGKIVAVGFHNVVRYNSNGSLDTTFGNNGIVAYPSGVYGPGVSAVLLQPMSDGSEDIVVGATTAGVGNSPNTAVLLRYTSNGTLDPKFGNVGEVVTEFPASYYAYVFSLALDNGDIVAGIGGTFGLPWPVVAYNASNGSLDTNFGSGGIASIQVGMAGIGGTGLTSMLVQPDGKIVAVGTAADSSTMSIDWGLGRLNTNGSLDTTFGNGGTVLTQVVSGDSREIPESSALQSNGEIVVTGSAGGGLALGVYNSYGSPDTSFGTGGFVVQSFNSGVAAYGVAVQPADGKLVIAGTTTLSNGKDDFFLARYIGTTTPTTATTFAAAVTSSGPTLAASPSGGSSNVGESLQASALGAIALDISQWEDALMQEQAAVVQALDQLFSEWDQTFPDSLAANPTLLS